MYSYLRRKIYILKRSLLPDATLVNSLICAKEEEENFKTLFSQLSIIFTKSSVNIRTRFKSVGVSASQIPLGVSHGVQPDVSKESLTLQRAAIRLIPESILDLPRPYLADPGCTASRHI